MPFERYAVFFTMTMMSSASQATAASLELHDDFVDNNSCPHLGIDMGRLR
jgi:hypothetical protein